MVKPHPSNQDENKTENLHPKPGVIRDSDPSRTQPLNPKHSAAVQKQIAQAYAYRSALLMLGAAFASAPLYIYLAGQVQAWQFTALIWTAIFIGILGALSALAARRGRVTLSVGILIGTFCLLAPVISMLVAGVGLVLGVGNTLAALIITGQTLKGRAAIRAGLAGPLSGVAALLIDVFWTSDRLVIPELQLFVPVLALITVSTLCITIFRQFSTYPLRIKLTVVLVGVAIVSISAVALTMNRVVSRELKQEVGSNLAALAKGKALEIGAILNRDTNTLESLALNEALQTDLQAANSANSADPVELAHLDETWKAAADNRDPLLSQVLNNAVSDELREYQGRFPEYAEIFLTDRYGANIAATSRTTDYSQADEAWWQSTWDDGAGRVIISQPEFDESTGVYAINLSIPVYADGDSEVIGILRATVNVTALKDTLGAGEFAQSESVDIVFPDHKFIHSDLEAAPTELDSASVDALNSLNESYSQFNYEGSPSLVSKSLVSVVNASNRDQIEALGWYVVAHQDEAEALQSIRSTSQTGVLIALIVLLLTGALAAYLGRVLARPLDELTTVAAQVSEGDLTAQVRITSQDEIGTLASTFNNMTRQLRSLVGSMEQRVAERTRDLELASEVGRTVSVKVADLQTLLSEAVELIRDRFNLYYTQIYLVEPDGRTLKLHAGTGTAGTALLQRGHHLLIGSGSVNGRAAANKQAVIVADITLNASFLPNPLLPKTRSEMAVPLLVGDHVVGVLDMQSEHANALTAGDLAAFEALAGQLAIAIQNARLFAEAQQSKMEVEAQARRLTRSGWEDFLDAVERSEQLGYAFDQDQVTLLDSGSSLSSAHVLTVPILITGEEVGTLQISNGTDNNWSGNEAEIARQTANLLAHQIENLRLLAQTEQYRAEAEEIAQRLTREGWGSYLKTRQQLSDGYIYNSSRVSPLPIEVQGDYQPAFSEPVVVRDEVIGELMVDHSKANDEAAAEMIAAVAEELSAHIENLRLLEQTQQRTLELEEAQTFLDSVIESLPHMLFVKDAKELRFVRWNRAAEELVGFTQDVMLGKNDHDFFPKEEADFFTAKDREVLDSGETLDIPEEPLATAHQGTRYMHTRKAPIYGADGKPKYLLGVAEDITDRLRAQEVIAKRATELATVAQVSTTTSTVLDPDNLLQSVVDLTKERFGLYHAHIYLADEAWQTLLLAAGAGEVGRMMVADHWSIPLDHPSSIVAAAARNKTPLIANDVYRDKDSGFLSNRLLPDTRSEMAVPMIVGERVLGVFDVQSNIAEYFTEEDANIYTTLAAQVAIALQNARLYAEQAATLTQLRELDRLKSSFLANMSHELRTPLNSILGFTDVIMEGLDGPLTENMDSDLRLIQKNGQHLLHLINDVLDMAKIEAGRMNLNPESFKTYEVLEEVASITSTLASEKNLSLFIDEAADRETKIYADRTRLRQVMINLVNNSIKFTEKGNVVLHVSPRDGARVLISVRDTGLGIPPEKLEAIFQEFTQVDSSTTRKSGGTGLGLPISRRLVEMHGGRLWADSTGIPGEGSIFFVELPLEARLTEVVEKQER